jgi:hypothetical protein
MKYEPQINDYVKWTKDVEGWVYFKDKEYITIEVLVRPKNKDNYRACALHRNERVLVLCYHCQWKELEYVKSRKSKHEEENCLEMVGESTWRESKQM